MSEETKTGAGPVPPAGDPPAGRPRNPFAAVKFQIEFATPDNNGTLCPITRRAYKGRFVMANMTRAGRMPVDGFVDMPDVPGDRITFTGSNRAVVVTDPTGDPEWRDNLKLARAVFKDMGWDEPEPKETREFRDLQDDDLKLWLYWCRRWVDARQVEVRSGQVPEMDAILALPGELRTSLMDNSQDVDRTAVHGKGRVPKYQPPPEPPRRGRRSRRPRAD